MQEEIAKCAAGKKGADNESSLGVGSTGSRNPEKVVPEEPKHVVGNNKVAAANEGRGENVFFVRLDRSTLQVKRRTRRQVTCSRCGLQGHNKNNRKCPSGISA